MKQYKMNRFLLSMLVLALTAVSFTVTFFYLQSEWIIDLMIGLVGIVGLFGVSSGLITALMMAFIITLGYGVLVLISGTTDMMEAILLSYVLLLLPTVVALVTGLIGFMNRKYLRLSKSFEEDFKELVRIDELTGFKNEVDYRETLEHEINRQKRYGSDLSVMLFHIESFETLNHLYGQSQGEKFIKYLSEFVIDLTRNVDMHFRIDENLFAMILPNTNKDGVKILKARFLEEIEHMNIVVKNDNQIIDLEVDLVYESYVNHHLTPMAFHQLMLDQLGIKPRGIYD
ncbi:MAG: GGDEF domain-containing protein [Clostridia bacterium]|nr:GGDEF domain-containing protein [Clostridia bacterium]